MNMQAVGKRICAYRKERDMTQVELADKLGVTYQAVSSWERGNSMPDIAKLPDISQVLAVSIDELLDNARASEIVKNVLNSKVPSISALELGALADVAPILKPSQVNTLAKQSVDGSRGAKATIDIDMLIQLAHHLESENLREIVLGHENITSDVVIEIACYMESEDLREVAMHCKHLDSDTLVELAAYLESEDLKEIILQCKDISKDMIIQLADYLESEDLMEILRG